jgi:hypothetical protein
VVESDFKLDASQRDDRNDRLPGGQRRIEVTDVDIADEMFDRLHAIDALRAVALDQEER